MHQYPLTITFPLFSVSPQVTVTDASGNRLFTAVKKLISTKDEINITSDGAPVYQVISQENRITDIPSNWDIKTADGQTIGVVDDDYISALDHVTFSDNTLANRYASRQLGSLLNIRNVKMYWVKDTNGNRLGFIAPEVTSLAAANLPLREVVRKLPIFFRLITPQYDVVLNGQRVLTMKKQRTILQDTYTLESHAPFTESEERMFIPSILLAVLYERQQLKDMYS